MTRYFCEECGREIDEQDVQNSIAEDYDESYCQHCLEKLERQEEERERDLRNEYYRSV